MHETDIVLVFTVIKANTKYSV